jgi:hypothetical protein
MARGMDRAELLGSTVSPAPSGKNTSCVTAERFDPTRRLPCSSAKLPNRRLRENLGQEPRWGVLGEQVPGVLLPYERCVGQACRDPLGVL